MGKESDFSKKMKWYLWMDYMSVGGQEWDDQRRNEREKVNKEGNIEIAETKGFLRGHMKA